MDRPDTSGVHLPPPILFLVCYGAAAALHALVPVRKIPAAAFPFGLALLTAGLIPLAWALFRFVRAHVDPLPNRPVDTLVVAGPYRFSRNPMYLGMLVVYLGVALLTRLTWALFLAPLLILVVNRLVIFREEAYLARRFGDDYRAYRSRVRRWI